MARGDLTDEEWSRLEAVLPPLPKMGRKPRDWRQVFDGIWWRARTGSPWRDAPDRYGPWETAYSVFLCWQIDGTWAHILKKVQVKAGRSRAHRMGGIGRLHPLPSPPARCRGAEMGAYGTGWTRANGLADEPDDHALGRSCGGLTTKIHLAVDFSFHVLAVVVTGVWGPRSASARASDLNPQVTRCCSSGHPGTVSGWLAAAGTAAPCAGGVGLLTGRRWHRPAVACRCPAPERGCGARGGRDKARTSEGSAGGRVTVPAGR
ncbi:IS5 family transposase [Streptomyces sp. NPDC047821]|uniref:IS5 family transposase n=1 Tax=Streptomyces sp. NPDC047821 TaxID=3365488 RepID=UPI00371CD487